MQFAPDIEKCIRKPLLVRHFPEPRRAEILKFLHQFRQIRRDMLQKWNHNN